MKSSTFHLEVDVIVTDKLASANTTILIKVLTAETFGLDEHEVFSSENLMTTFLILILCGFLCLLCLYFGFFRLCGYKQDEIKFYFDEMDPEEAYGVGYDSEEDYGMESPGEYNEQPEGMPSNSEFGIVL